MKTKSYWVRPKQHKEKCKVCKRRLAYEQNVFIIDFYCVNAKCKSYLLRTGGRSKSFTGKYESETKPKPDDFVKDNLPSLLIWIIYAIWASAILWKVLN